MFPYTFNGNFPNGPMYYQIFPSIFTIIFPKTNPNVFNLQCHKLAMTGNGKHNYH